MKITKKQLRKIIKEELNKAISEITGMPSGEEYASAVGTIPTEFGGGEVSPDHEISLESQDQHTIDYISRKFKWEWQKMGIEPDDLATALLSLDQPGAAAELVNTAAMKILDPGEGEEPTPRDPRIRGARVAASIATALGLSFKSIKSPRHRY